MDNPSPHHQINAPKPLEPFELMLTESIQRFSSGHRSGFTDFSCITSIFSRLLQTMTDPPLEIVWFYTSLTFRTHHFTLLQFPNRVLAVKNLFKGLVSCSCSYNGIKQIAALAPIIYEVYDLMVDYKYLQCKEDIDCLVEGIISYISICCMDDFEGIQGLDELGPCFSDVISMWMINDVEGDSRKFFPLVSDEVRRRVSEGCVVGDLAGVVMCEAFLLSMCLKFGSGVLREELQKDLHNWAANAMFGFRNFYFLDALLRILLEPVLPVTSLLVFADVILLQEALYDAVIAAGNSFFNSQKGTSLSSNNARSLAVTWLFVADCAMRFLREKGDMNKVICYENAFSESYLPSHLIKWVTNQIAMEEKTSRPNISSPIALIKWLLTMEDQGLGILDHDSLKFHIKAAMYKSDVENKLNKVDGKIQDDMFIVSSVNEERLQDKFNCDNKMDDSINPLCMANIVTSNVIASVGGRKRKEERNDIGEIQVKFVKVHNQGNLLKDGFSPFHDEDGLSSGSEVDNPVNDEDMEDIVQ